MGLSSSSSVLLVLLAAGLCSGAAPEADAPTAAAAPREPIVRDGTTKAAAIEYEIIGAYPHDTRAYTQGLFWSDGYLYEGTGRYGTSWLRKVEPTTGEVLQQVSLPSQYFGEGIARLNDRVYQLTWLSKRGFIYDADSFESVGEFSYKTEGWGLTTDGTELILSDGSENLYFIEPRSHETTRTVRVHDAGRGIDDLNELEYVDGRVYANVWKSDTVYQIAADSGLVTGHIDFSGLLAGERPRDSEAVLNGIAYNPANGHLFVTGKQWPTLFEIRLRAEASRPAAPETPKE